MRFIQFFAVALLVGSLPSTPAWADVAARYEQGDDNAVVALNMTIEANDSGDVRFQMRNLGGYYLLREGTMYLVQKDADSFIVMRLDDVMTVQNEALGKMGWKKPEINDDDFPKSSFAPMSIEIVGGRSGMAYGMVRDTGESPTYASMVISDDPALAPIGKAMALAQDQMFKSMGNMGLMLGQVNEDLRERIGRGAILRMMSVELTDVSFDQIPDDRFALPTTPMTLEELRAATDTSIAPPPTLPAPKE